jgi:hypothetical protein
MAVPSNPKDANKTATDKAADVNPDETPAEGGPNTGVVQVRADEFAALKEQLARLTLKQEEADADKEAALKRAAGPTHVEDIEPDGEEEAEPTYIAYNHTYKDNDGVQQVKTYRMKSEHFDRISAERGW